MHIGFATAAVVAAFILGALEGGRVWTWIKGKFSKATPPKTGA
jgi:hypothetical protein